MRLKVLFIILLAIVVTANSSGITESFTSGQSNLEISDQICVPYTKYEDYCNTCTCLDNGKDWHCSTMYCDKGIWNKNGTLKFSGSELIKRGLFCEPRSTFKNYCNGCRCLTNGENAVCESKACDPTIWNRSGSLISEVGKQPTTEESHLFCKPHAAFKNYCNTCKCSSDGKTATCTLKDCDTRVWNKDGTFRDGNTLWWYQAEESTDYFCEAGSTFKDYCDTCTCLDDGRTAACTMTQACDPKMWNRNGTMKFDQKSVRDPEHTCEPHSKFTNRCGNECTCDYDGKHASCTLMACYATFYMEYMKRLWEREDS